MRKAQIDRPQPAARSTGFIIVTTLMLAVATGIACLSLWPSYESLSFIVMVIVTFVAGVSVAILGAVFRWNSTIVLASTLAAFLLLGVPLAVPEQATSRVLPSLAGLRELVVGAATAWKQLLTISLPVGDYEALLVPAFIIVLVTSVVSLSIALRSRFGELAVFGPIAVFIFGIAFGPDSALWPFPVAIGLTGAILLWLIWARWYRRRESIRLLPSREVKADNRPIERIADGGFVGVRTLLSAGLIFAIAGSGAFVAAGLVPPTQERLVLRSSIAQPFDARDYPSPLSGFRMYEQDALRDRTVFIATDLPQNSRLRIATLDSYDGVVYSLGQRDVSSASGLFTRVPQQVDQSGVDGTVANILITVGDYSGVWLPTVGNLERVSFSGRNANSLLGRFYYNDNSDTAAVVGGLSSGEKYSLTVVLPKQPDVSELSTLTPGAAQLPPLTSVPDALATALDGFVSGVDGPGSRLVAMLEGLKSNGYISHGVSALEPVSRSGHSAGRITELLTAPRMIGDQEQFAVTAALMARQLGFPARVVFGFVPQNINSDGATPVVGGDVSAWIEVNTAKFGWVTIDPTPPVRPIPEEQPQEPTKVSHPQSPVQPQTPDIQNQSIQPPPNVSQELEPPENPVLAVLLRVLVVAGWVLAGIAVLLSPFVTIVVAKWRRRRLRRHAATPIQIISGGWEEFADAVIDHGYTPGQASTRLEVAQSVGGTQPFVLAAVIDRAIFAPGEPDRWQAEQMWKSVDELRFSLDDHLTRWQRVRALISLRSLGGYSVSSLFKRERSK